MRRGGVLILLIGLILIVGAVALFLFLQPTGGIGGAQVPTGEILPTEPPSVEVVRARVDIPAGTVITDSATLLELVTISQNEFDSNENFSTLPEVEGLLTLRPFRANEALVRSAMVEPGLAQQIPTAEADRARDKAYPLLVSNLSGVADQVRPGDFIDVVATFNVARPISQITQSQTSVDAAAGTAQQSITNNLADQVLRSTKTIVQRVQVLRVIRPPVEAAATPEGGAPAEEVQVDEQGRVVQPEGGAAPEGTITAGTWTLVLAVNDQEVELVEFAIASEARLTLVLRGSGDTGFEPTIGVTLDLLIAEFGLPQPQPLSPYVISVEQQLTPQPTRTPAPTRVP